MLEPVVCIVNYNDLTQPVETFFTILAFIIIILLKTIYKYREFSL